MPSQSLHRTPSAVRKYDVVGTIASGTSGFVFHIGLSADDRMGVTSELPIRIVDMGPPLSRGGGMVCVDVAGSVPLRNGEDLAIDVFFDGVEFELAAANATGSSQYAILPHVREQASDGRTPAYRRFSCSGLVLAAYDFIGIALVNETLIPHVGLDALRLAYPNVRGLDNPDIRARYGLKKDDTSWPVMLPGYVIHSLRRSEAEIRAGAFAPQAGDECFPTIATDPSTSSPLDRPSPPL